MKSKTKKAALGAIGDQSRVEPSNSGPGLQLPEDVLFIIFGYVQDDEDMGEIYSTLFNASLVCRQWAVVASRLLLSYVEISGKRDARLVQRTLRRLSASYPEAAPIHTLVWSFQAHPKALERVLRFPASRNIRKLVLYSMNPIAQSPPRLASVISSMSLVDVTVTYDPGFTRLTPYYFLHYLPSTVRFLQIPFDGIFKLQHDAPPSFSLISLTVETHPSETSDWVLQKSRDTLRFLTVSVMKDNPALHRRFPNLISLTILASLHDSVLLEIPRLTQLRALELPLRPIPWDTRGAGFPKSLEYLTISNFCQGHYMEEGAFDRRKVPNLKVVHVFISDDLDTAPARLEVLQTWGGQEGVSIVVHNWTREGGVSPCQAMVGIP